MKAWWGEVLDKVLKALKALMPAIAVAVYDHLKHRIKREENKNKKLQTEIDIKREQDLAREKNANTSDADLIDEFIADSSSKPE